MRAESFLTGRRWIHGPKFLCESKEVWPKLDVDLHVIPVDDAEVKKEVMKRKELCGPVDLSKDKMEQQEQEVKRKLQSFKATLKGQSLTPEDLEKAEQSIILFSRKKKVN
ncbi:hypothetical protein JOB18_008155 [Solea senegalensis]|uniref:Uncharacterized protein n=1 Tax=Solea senegalensis TaxID=28829 RepID=A0AAV6P9Q1_SOLSE|nr:hypothetical protein JOB18_008155 [Solea senegalensis]